MMSLSCDRVQDILPELAAGRMDAAQRGLLEAHLDACADCRAQYEVVRAVYASTPALPEGLESRVLTATRARPAARRWGTTGQLAIAATVAAAVIGGTLLFDAAPRTQPAATPVTQEPAPLAESALPLVEDPMMRSGPVLADLTEAELLALLEKMES